MMISDYRMAGRCIFLPLLLSFLILSVMLSTVSVSGGLFDISSSCPIVKALTKLSYNLAGEAAYYWLANVSNIAEHNLERQLT